MCGCQKNMPASLRIATRPQDQGHTRLRAPSENSPAPKTSQAGGLELQIGLQQPEGGWLRAIQLRVTTIRQCPQLASKACPGARTLQLLLSVNQQDPHGSLSTSPRSTRGRALGNTVQGQPLGYRPHRSRGSPSRPRGRIPPIGLELPRGTPHAEILLQALDLTGCRDPVMFVFIPTKRIACGECEIRKSIAWSQCPEMHSHFGLMAGNPLDPIS